MLSAARRGVDWKTHLGSIILRKFSSVDFRRAQKFSTKTSVFIVLVRVCPVGASLQFRSGTSDPGFRERERERERQPGLERVGLCFWRLCGCEALGRRMIGCLRDETPHICESCPGGMAWKGSMLGLEACCRCDRLLEDSLRLR
uniref:Uncharacterized protein n=1 Tax=Physcomitrium patens TaxID=3218 RepID=A0A2K1L4E8_PHYPA|nr:hypothetical protein PHYPA_003695 [Physcomitrium patens]